MRDQYVCRTCGQTCRGKRFVPGSFFVELFLWIFGMVGGLIYSIWRISSACTICEHCGDSDLVPLYSPMGDYILRHLRD